MDGKEIKLNLFRWGHFRNPVMPTGIDDESDLENLSLTSKEVQTAIRSYQEFMSGEFDRVSLETHGRAGIVDGELGPATGKLLELPRCGEPDYPEEVELATGSGSWPAGCWAEYPNNHAFAIHWNRRNMPSFLNDVIDECIRRCYAAYHNMGIAFFTSSDPNKCNTRVTWEPGRGWIGLAIVGQNQTCRSRIWAKFDTRYRPSKMIDQWSRLLAHEFGHNMGLRHSRGGIMNPSISSGPFTETAWRGDPSEPILRRWFGGEPVPRRDDPNPPADPPTTPDVPGDGSGLAFRGSFQAEIDGKPAGEFVLIPKPKA